MKQTLHREILCKTMGFCREQRALTDVENEIATYPEFRCATQDQYHLISFLVDAGGLDRLELDVDGEVVCEERKADLTEDEIDDLVVSYAFVTTAAGLVVFEEQLRPDTRVRDALAGTPEHADTYLAIMAFCRESRTYQEIEDLLTDSGLSLLGAEEDAVHPSCFVNALETAGALVWNGEWLLSDDGRALLENTGKEARTAQGLTP
jgi:hypothetical protein